MSRVDRTKRSGAGGRSSSRGRGSTGGSSRTSGAGRVGQLLGAGGSLDVGPTLAADDVLSLQESAGNHAVTAALQRSTADAAMSLARNPFEPIGADSGAAPESMSYNELGDAIDEHRQFLDGQTATTPEVVRREQRVAALVAAREKLAARAMAPTTSDRRRKGGRGGGGRKGRRPSAELMPERPRMLGSSLDLSRMDPAEIKHELDLVVAYLAARPPKDERKVLLAELPNLEAAAGVVRTNQRQSRHEQRVETALTPPGGAETDQFEWFLGRIEGAERDRSREDTWLIHFGQEVVPISTAELDGLRQTARREIVKLGRKIRSFANGVEIAYEDRMNDADSHPWAHGLSSWAAGVDDIPRSEITRMIETTVGLTRRARERAEANAFARANNDLVLASMHAEAVGKRVGTWQSALESGAGRWVLGLTVLKESLSLVVGIGGAGLAAKGATLGAKVAQGAVFAAEATAVGAAAGGVTAAAVGGDVVGGIRKGGAAGFGAGANAMTGPLGEIAPLSEVAKQASRTRKLIAAGKALAIDAGGNVATSAAGAAIEGSSVKDAALGALAAAPINAIGGHLVDARFGNVGAQAVKKAVGRGVVGGAAGAAGSLAKGEDVTTGIVSGIATGALGSGIGSLAANQSAKAAGQGTNAPGAGHPAIALADTVPAIAAADTVPAIAAADTVPVRSVGLADTVPAVAAADTAPVGSGAHADTVPAGAATVGSVPVGAATAGTVRVAEPAAGASGRPKARPLLPDSIVPQDLPEASTPAIDPMRAASPSAFDDAGHDLPPASQLRSTTPSADYPIEQPGRYKATGEKPVAGVSAEKSYVVEDALDGKSYLFKPKKGELPIDRAEARGIREGEQAPREVAAPMVAEALGLDAPKGRLATIDGEQGVLVEWRASNSLKDLAITDPQGFMRLVRSKTFRDAMTSVDALDYLVNNLDRGTNFGNYLYEFTPDGLKLTPIDHGLTFTSTKDRASIEAYTRDLPEKYPPDLAANLERLDRNRGEFVEKLRPFVGDAAVDGFVHRLDIMLEDMRMKGRPTP